MPTMKLNKNEVARLPAPHPSGKQTIYWDTALRGFGVLCSGTTNGKSYVVQHTLPTGNTRRMTIGPTNVLELEGTDGARARAKAVIGQFYSGVDPKAEQRKAREQAKREAGGTLRAVLEGYLRSKAKLAGGSKVYYRRMIEGYLGAWLDKPLSSITAKMVEARHGGIAKEIAERNAGSRRGGGPTEGQSTANMVMRLLSILWAWGTKPHRYPEFGPSPTWILEDRWFPQTRRERLVKADDLPAFYKAVDALPNRTASDYLKLLLFTGLRRRREAGSLRWDDIDFAARLIRLPASRTKPGRKLDLPMSSFVRELLVARRAIGIEGPFVFPANSKAGFFDDSVGALELVKQATGIEVSAHDLRRTFITNAEATDISVMALKALVNHQLPESDVTAGYVQMTVDRLREPTQRVCDRLLSLCMVPDVGEEVARLA